MLEFYLGVIVNNLCTLDDLFLQQSPLKEASKRRESSASVGCLKCVFKFPPGQQF